MQTPRKVGRYEILREIGRGGTSVVFLARQVDLDRHVALKELAGFHAADPAFLERFVRESRLAGSLSHPNIVTVHEYFDHEGTAFIAMEYFERGSLRPHVGHLELAQIVGVLEGLLGGLAHAEEHRIVHRDLKPENLMVTASGGVKIADFGMAKAMELRAGDGLTPSGATVGTPAYMAPEQALGDAVGPWTDLYSVGVIAYELIARTVPFGQAESPMAIMLRHLNDEVPPLPSTGAEVDPELAAWVERLLSKGPSDRPQSAAAASEQLDEIVISVLGPRWRRQSRLRADEAGSSAEREAARTRATVALPASPPARMRRRVWLAAALTTFAVLAAAGAVAAVVLPGDGSEREAAAGGTTPSTPTQPSKPSTTSTGPVLARAGVDVDENLVTATLRFRGPALGPGRILVRDAEIADGRSVLELRQRGITARTRGGTYGPVALRIRRGRNLVRIDVTADPGSFSSLRALRRGGGTVLVELVKATPRAERDPSPPPATTTPEPKPKSSPPKKPSLETG